MAEEEKKDDKKEEDKGPNGCIVCLTHTVKVIIGIFNAIKWCVMMICEGISYCWYPMKERCVTCCTNCNRRLNPHEDEAFRGFE